MAKKKISKKRYCEEQHQSDALCSAPQHALHQWQVGQVGQNMKRKQNKDAPPLRQTPRHNHVQHNVAWQCLGWLGTVLQRAAPDDHNKKLTENNKHTTQSASRNKCTNWYTQSKANLKRNARNAGPRTTPHVRQSHGRTYPRQTRSTIAHASRNQGAA